MKAILDNKLYDTKKSELVFSYQSSVESAMKLLGVYPMYVTHYIDIYKTQKGAYFEHDKYVDTLTLTTAKQVRTLIQKLDPERYMALFDPTIEEG